jgi:hypothetical protein
MDRLKDFKHRVAPVVLACVVHPADLEAITFCSFWLTALAASTNPP